ncbi:COX15/CtaA family protein [Rhodobacter ferrooxidans]|uniref:Cytochrome oxidase assembly n=1 Tax=Rhodobacter ferrooxidans TaxID=371731 RepID=C8RW28_9RHOB|nr:COX15/CtaA family protein [Rhodobacter sp. SW2]EEW26771.1 cytochrome oxidase assembly [Rhodobacter sp. SW2]
MAGKRSIFEEVGQGSSPAPVQTGGIDRGTGGGRLATRLWVLLLLALVAALVVQGGLMRLFDTGLMIPGGWPLTGFLPPLTEADWAAAFARYQMTPEYLLQNKAMKLDVFKSAYLWPWSHVLLSRLSLLVWLLGFAGLGLAKRIPAGWSGRLLALGVLIGGQGLVGWWLVDSGQAEGVVDSSALRLAVHLGLAFLAMGLAGWFVLLLGRPEKDLLAARRNREGKLYGMTSGLMHFAFVQVVLGALVAGNNAGAAFPTWPLMNGSFFPADAFYAPGRPAWAAFVENPGMVQFVHRMVAYLLVAYGIVVWLKGRKSAHLATRRAYYAVGLMLLAQVGLGIAAVLTAGQLHAAVSHQVGAVLLWVLILRARHLAQYPIAGSIRKGTQ